LAPQGAPASRRLWDHWRLTGQPPGGLAACTVPAGIRWLPKQPPGAGVNNAAVTGSICRWTWLADAILDRLVHHAHALNLAGASLGKL
jgi:hypothetical protein